MSDQTSQRDRPASGTPERDLIERALRQASPAGTTAGPGDGAGLPPPGTFEGYEVVREIHRGGQGVVYLAIQVATKRKVAIKVMHTGPFGGSAGRARFEREVQVLGQLRHPNIVQIHDSGTTARGDFYYVMDYVSGQSLEELLRGASPGPVRSTLEFFVKICDAVNAAHLRGIIHRDLKPSNIRIDRDGNPVVVDFGLAKVAVPEAADGQTPALMSMTGQFIGSLPWASPEQAEGAPGQIDIRTDVYSLGVILYQLLTGRFPYEVRGNMRDVLDRILTSEPARPSTVRRGINNEVETIVLKCLAKDRDRRYQSAGELARDIRRYLAGEPIEAKRDSGWYVIAKTMRRYRGRVGVAVAFLLVVFAFAIGMTVLYRSASAARDEARFHRDQLLGGVWGMAFDVADEVEHVVGATAARERVLTLLRRSLPDLRRRLGDDPAFAARVADLHDRYGVLLGRMYAANLGRPAEARAAHEEARRIRGALAPAESADASVWWSRGKNHVAMGRLVRQLDRDLPAALREVESGIEAFDRAAALAGDDAARRAIEADRADAILLAADYRLAQASDLTPEMIVSAYALATAYWSDRLVADPEDAQARREIARIENKTAQKLTDAATAIYNALGSGGEADRARAERALGMLREAEALSSRALAGMESLLRASPADADLARDVDLCRHHLGQALFMRAMFARRQAGEDEQRARAEARPLLESALALFDAAVEHAGALASTDLKNAEAARDLVLYLNKRGNAHRELWLVGAGTEHAEAAREDFSRSEQERARLAAAEPTPLRRRELAVARYKLGQLIGLLARHERDPARRARLADDALAWYDLAQRGFLGLKADGVEGMDAILQQVAQERADALELSRSPGG